MTELGILLVIFGASWLGRVRWRYWITEQTMTAYGLGAWLAEVTLMSLVAALLFMIMVTP